MKPWTSCFAPLLALAFCATACASELEMVVRVHSRQIVFGDPLYIELSINNRSTDTISAPVPNPVLPGFEFAVYDDQTELHFHTSVGKGFGGGQQKYFPNVTVKSYHAVYLPHLVYHDHRFWTPFGEGRSMRVIGQLSLRKGLYLFSNAADVYVSARDKDQLRALLHWSRVKVTDYENVPHIRAFGLQVNAVNAAQTLDLASKIGEGEICDVLQLTLKLQQLQSLPPDQREPRNRDLVQWLQKQPDIKRQCLARETRAIAAGHDMDSTAEAVKMLCEDNP